MRPAVPAAREAPLNEIHLENMLMLTRVGATILPPMLAFYNQPSTLHDAIDHVIMKTLDQFGIDAHLAKRWATPSS